MIDILFPYSYVIIIGLILLGISLITILIGFISAIVLLFLIYSGVIRISPILQLLTDIVSRIMPNRSTKIQHNIKESFKTRFTEDIPEGKYIYAWHPHGVISMSQFFHIGTHITDWPSHLRPIKGAILSHLQWLPFGKELFEYSRAIPSEYHSMKNALEEGTSISIALGGMREMLGESYIVKKRRGIFKMALETGTPIIPVLSFGENTLYKLITINSSIQKWLEPYDICVCIPTLGSVMKWFGMLYSPLKDPITSVVGKPIPVAKIDNPTEKDISDLRTIYIEALKDLYMKENPNKTEPCLII